MSGYSTSAEAFDLEPAEPYQDTDQPPFPVPAGLDPAAFTAGWPAAPGRKPGPQALERVREMLMDPPVTEPPDFGPPRVVNLDAMDVRPRRERAR